MAFTVRAFFEPFDCHHPVINVIINDFYRIQYTVYFLIRGYFVVEKDNNLKSLRRTFNF
jgi:hypothetical protein